MGWATAHGDAAMPMPPEGADEIDQLLAGLESD
ncbi:hypothetical protein RLDS_01245 [Sphingobium lactosutens DS20]|uniref:Uncharacterized protein n=1 Tax=Sphingobium lactosutens DS20 TaxID=1331060 RepID=T0I3N8_9SPHN|nr:hypothetical protein RLDS_01245 [Sphingobium lactosutens DS20]